MQKVEEQNYQQQFHDHARVNVSQVNELILASLSEFRKERLVKILKDNGLDHVGEKDQLLKLLQISLYRNQVDTENIKERILNWETWSRRHTYFFDLDGLLPSHQELLNSIPDEYKQLLNKSRQFSIPLKRQVDSILIDEKSVKVFMSEPATVELREESEDEYNEGLRKYAYRDVRIRKVFYFELNLESGASFISIPAIQTRSKYSKEVEAVLVAVRKIFPEINLAKVQIRKSISTIRMLENIINKGLDVNLGNLTAALRMKNKNSLTDKNVPKEVAKIINDGHLEEGIFEVDDLDSKTICSMRIYKDSRLGIFRDLDEEEYRYVCELVTDQSL